MTETGDAPACPVVPPQKVRAAIAKGNLRLTDRGGERWCPGCSEWWPADTEFWHLASSKQMGLQTYCRACMSDRRRERYERKEKEVAA